jgi:2,3-bisphosphoglycerate-dependent phosphoglycerate mutase
MNRLVMVRHAESVYNEQGLWAGITDVPLSIKGEIEARDTGRAIKNINPDANWQLFVSPLIRTKKTASLAVEAAGLTIERMKIAEALIERDYGVFTGLNKWEMKQKLGEEEFLKLRRSYDHPIDDGESLKQVYERVVPWFQEEVEPLLKEGKDVLLVAHGNSLRALIKYIEHVSDEGIAHVEMETGKPRVYDWHGDHLSREIHE